MTWFKTISSVNFEGLHSNNPIAFKIYDSKERIDGKTMAEHMRFAVAIGIRLRWMGPILLARAL